MKNWNLDVLYQKKEDFEDDLKKLETLIDPFENFKGKLHKLDKLKEFYENYEAFNKLLFRLWSYASLKGDTNLKDTNNASNFQRVRNLMMKFMQVISYVDPELISIGEKKINKFLSRDPFLKQYSFSMQQLFYNQKHILSEKEEKIMANYGGIRSVASNIYQSLSIVDAKDTKVALSDGSEVTVTLSNYRSLIPTALNADDRKLIFEAAFKRFSLNKTSYANVYNLILQNLKASYISRGYSSALEAALDSNNIPVSVYLNLKDVAYENTDPVKRYLNLRKQYLNLEEYHTYDRFLRLVSDDKKYPYEEAKKMFFESLSAFSDEFVLHEKQALEDGYVDVDPKDGKRTGAYSSGFYGQHPFILLNHDETLDSVFTVAHEAGHSAHTIFSNENQPMATADYTIFVAEIASTFNEHLLLDYLLSKAKTRNEKINLLESAIDTIMGTFYRQTLFATYEYEANKLVENNVPITADNLSKIMIDLYKHYYDLDITKEDGKQYVWAYIPHLFGTPFYVYQYATSYSASLKFYENVKKKEPNAMKNYLDLLKSGGSDFPINLVAKAGVDLTNKDSFLAVVNRFNELLDQLEDVLKEK
ncbi:oligoendopeptidase F [Acholeplasma sp. OttesenSCG-928-E16]|nr:oligoendopeptidase F [Acholeplasma sp. OttesenSCG-928-E16]